MTYEYSQRPEMGMLCYEIFYESPNKAQEVCNEIANLLSSGYSTPYKIYWGLDTQSVRVMMPYTHRELTGTVILLIDHITSGMKTTASYWI